MLTSSALGYDWDAWPPAIGEPFQPPMDITEEVESETPLVMTSGMLH